MGERMEDVRMNGHEDGWEGTWMGGGCMDGRMNGWTRGDGWVDGWMSRWGLHGQRWWVVGLTNDRNLNQFWHLPILALPTTPG